MANWQRVQTTASAGEEHVFTSQQIAQLFDLTFLVSENWRILIDVHTPAGDGWATMNCWLDQEGNLTFRGVSAQSLGKYVWRAVLAGCRVRVVQGDQL